MSTILTYEGIMQMSIIPDVSNTINTRDLIVRGFDLIKCA